MNTCKRYEFSPSKNNVLIRKSNIGLLTVSSRVSLKWMLTDSPRSLSTSLLASFKPLNIYHYFNPNNKYSGLMDLISCYGAGHVPHTGNLAPTNKGAPLLNPSGIVGKLDTHHILISWLNEVASKNILSILVTLETFQLFNG